MSKQLFANNSRFNAEQQPLSPEKAELLREYAQVVESNFALFHKYGYGSDPEAILSALGVRQVQQPKTEQPTSQSAPTEAVNNISEADARRQAQQLAQGADGTLKDLYGYETAA